MPALKGNKYALKNRGGGRHSGYRPEFAKMAAKACELGATNFELGQMFSVSTATIITWTHLHEEFSDAVKVDKEDAERSSRAITLRSRRGLRPRDEELIFEILALAGEVGADGLIALPGEKNIED